MGRGLDTGRGFMQGVLSKITDPTQRAAAEQLLANDAVLTEIGNGVEGQAEISRQLADLRTRSETLTAQQTDLDAREAGLTSWHGELQGWYQSNKTALEEYKVLKAGGRGSTQPGTGTQPASGATPPGLTAEQLNEQIGTERAAFLGFQRDQNQITREHFTKFQEIVELEPLLRHPRIAELGLTGVYELVHKDRLSKFQEDAAKKREDEIRADERRKTLEGQASMPYPSPTGVGSGSPLDALQPANKEPVVDAAVAHYNRLQAERVGGAPA